MLALFRLWFDTEEEFFAAASKCASLYFLPERRIFFAEQSLRLPHHDGAVYRILQRGEESEIVLDNTGGAVYDAAIALSRYLAGLHDVYMHTCIYTYTLCIHTRILHVHAYAQKAEIVAL